MSDLIHAGVAVIVVLCATVLALVSIINASQALLVYGTALGYAAGRSGTVSP